MSFNLVPHPPLSPILFDAEHFSSSCRCTVDIHGRAATTPSPSVGLLPACFNSAHGRLGTGDNRCRHEPVRLKVWPPGFPGCVVKDVALGGAHSIVLAHRSVTPTTLANPWGVESLAYAWGYGYCGQLGFGQAVRLIVWKVLGGCGQLVHGGLASFPIIPMFRMDTCRPGRDGAGPDTDSLDFGMACASGHRAG